MRYYLTGLLHMWFVSFSGSIIQDMIHDTTKMECPPIFTNPLNIPQTHNRIVACSFNDQSSYCLDAKYATITGFTWTNVSVPGTLPNTSYNSNNGNGFLYGNSSLYKYKVPFMYSDIKNFDYYVTMAYSAFGQSAGSMVIQMTDKKTPLTNYAGDTVKVTNQNATSVEHQWGVINARFTPYSTNIDSLLSITTTAESGLSFGIDDICIYQVCSNGFLFNAQSAFCEAIKYCPASCGGNSSGCIEIDDATRRKAWVGANFYTAPKYKCLCNKGYSNPPINGDYSNRNYEKCEDRNECADVDKGGCNKTENVTNPNSACYGVFQCYVNSSNLPNYGKVCLNKVGGFECGCDVGFKSSANNTCERINPCDSNPCPGKSVCKPDSQNPQLYTCFCDSSNDNSTGLCRDPDMCTGTSNCGNVKNSYCNTTGLGTYECVCKDGYYALPGTLQNDNAADINYTALLFPRQCEDINECEDLSICGENAECVNTPGSYECICNNGFVGDYSVSNKKRKCQDINECKLKSNAALCPNQEICSNTVGSYMCVCANNVNRNPVTQKCEDPCVPNGVTVFAIPCDRDIPVERAFNTCINLNNGNFKCVCPDGYLDPREEDFYICRDINECDSPDTCSKNAQCNNFVGGYNCTCKSGFNTSTGGKELPGDLCKDIDECVRNPCLQPNSTCQNSEGSYYCDCESGLELKKFANGSYICVDIEECKTGASNCDLEHGNCIELYGSFKCNCNPGYVGSEIENSYICEDINECEKLLLDGCYSNDSDVSASCHNEVGCFSCKCPPGYTGNGFALGTKHLTEQGLVDGNGCFDVDECVQNPCNPNEMCQNTIGSYSCFCDTQFYYVTEYNECRDIDECATKTATCPPHSSCKNTIGNYTCVCDEMYSGAGCEFDGYWSEWQNTGNCSAACGTGVVNQVRKCLMGSNCKTYPEGSSRTRACNTELCSTVSGLVKSCWCENVTHFLNYTELQAYTDQSNKEVDKNKQAVVDIFNKWTLYPIDEGCFIGKLNIGLKAINDDIIYVEQYFNTTLLLKESLIKIIHCNANAGIRSSLTGAYKHLLNEQTQANSFLNDLRSKRSDLTKKTEYCSSFGWLDTLWNSVSTALRRI